MYEDNTTDDSNSLILSNEFSFYQTLKEKNSIAYNFTDERYYFNQQSEYLLAVYNRKTADHTFALPGYIYKKNVPWQTSNLGIEWIPKLNYKVRADEKTFQSTIDVGPVFSSKFFTIPLKVRTGVSADVWKENITDHVFQSILHNYSSDPGYYVGGEFGDETHIIPGMPLYFSFKATGRSVRNAGLGLLMGNLLYVHDPGSGDSLIFSASDSLSNGKESFLNQGATFLTTPWRIVHGLAAGGGLKTAERVGFRTSMFYRYTQHSARYPSDSSQLNDVMNRGHHINLQLSSLDHFFFNYSGGFECIWSAQDWLYHSDALPSVVRSSVDVRKSTVNLDDHSTFIANMDHDLAVPLPAQCTLEYRYHISRESNTYNNYFVYTGSSNRDTIRNQMENDGVERLHHLGLTRSDSNMFYGGVEYDYGTSVLHYLRKERSGSSRTRVTHRIGTFLGLHYGKLALKEEITIQGEKSEYVFRDAHVDPFDPPPQSRNLNSLLTGSWTFNERYIFVCKWNEQYRDDGRWYGKEYMSDTAGNVDYYAIQNKTNDYSIAMHLEIALSQIDIKVGGSFRDIYSRRYSAIEKKYISSEIGEGYLYEPFVQFYYQVETVMVGCKVKRNFNTIDPQRWSLDNNWDITLSTVIVW
jgi:hypothetical protein